MNTILIKLILLVNVPFFPQQLQSYLLEKGLRTEIVVSRLDDVNLLGNQNLLFNYLSTAFRYNPKYLSYVITERFLGADNNLYHLGFARPIERLAMGTYGENPELGNKRLYKTYLIAAHEISHMLGVGHDGVNECKTIMDANAGNCLNWIDLGFSVEQLRIMNKRRATRRRNLTTCFVRWE